MRTGEPRAGRAVSGLLLVPALAACGAAEHVRELSTAERAVVRQAEEELVRRCMAAQGFRYWPAAVNDPEASRQFDYVVDDITWAGTYGYGPDAPTAGPNATYRARLPAKSRKRYDRALDGSGRRVLKDTLPTGQTIQSPAEGCSAHAEQKLYGDRAVWFHARVVADNLAPLYQRKVLAHPRYLRAERAWAACMRERGFPYTSPGESRDRATAARRSGAEVRTAVAEARCARRTGLAEVAKELDRKFGAPARERYSAEVSTQNRLRLHALSTARTIVTDPR
ncbi:hypothetical protein [Streptomyces boluensis]|uniref:Lipoprotein n=1 Tax=Streptomyces boluensis TaxID=1775135 RepID=A0A964UPI7_9ACTN|nr:hypothetical protein [Streptomyces boluensis]NBE50672.1 hypothetical protein [Streptomyces boluensis]